MEIIRFIKLNTEILFTHGLVKHFPIAELVGGATWVLLVKLNTFFSPQATEGFTDYVNM